MLSRERRSRSAEWPSGNHEPTPVAGRSPVDRGRDGTDQNVIESKAAALPTRRFGCGPARMVGTVVSLDEMTAQAYESIGLSVVKVGMRLDVSEDETN